jgi:hypothetical protein
MHLHTCIVGQSWVHLRADATADLLREHGANIDHGLVDLAIDSGVARIGLAPIVVEGMRDSIL